MPRIHFASNFVVSAETAPRWNITADLHSIHLDTTTPYCNKIMKAITLNISTPPIKHPNHITPGK